MKRLDHKNIARMLGVVISGMNFSIIFEYSAAGNLREKLTDGPPFPFELVVQILVDISHALSFLHKKGVVHCDVKSANILLDLSGRAKLCDMGSSWFTTKKIAADDESTIDVLGRVGTYPYMAPEVLRGEGVRTACDIFSFGVVVWEILNRSLPHDGLHLNHLTTAVGYMGYTLPVDTVSELTGFTKSQEQGLRALMIECMAFDARKRPTFEQIIVRLNRIYKNNDEGSASSCSS
eukprot:Trichotokara_eunicae@DN5158_c0_g1_i2.p1